jgi:hypothetical protein
MERLLVIGYIRAGYLAVTAKAVMDAARSAGVVARIKSPRLPSLPYEPARRTAAAGESFAGVAAVFICPLGRGGAYRHSLPSIPRTVTFRGMTGIKNPRVIAFGGAAETRAAILSSAGSPSDLQPITGGESKVATDPRMKELLSAAIANSNACQNWLSKAPPNLERARVSIGHVLRDVNDLARMFDQVGP